MHEGTGMGNKPRGLGRLVAITVAAAALALGQAVAVGAAPPAPAVAAVATPPMGWASWNSFAAGINADVIKSQADALVSSGLKDAGYQYVDIDEGWWQGTRDSAGNIT
ncbi:alpha-galactosidase, partial [Kutzneria sp. 744]